MAKKSATKTNEVIRPRHQLAFLANQTRTHLCSVGDIEQLAGVDIYSIKERKALWDQFKSLREGDTQVLCDAVMDHCSAIALKRINSGELCLVGSYHRKTVGII